MAEVSAPTPDDCTAIDLEIGRDSRLLAAGAVRGETAFERRGGGEWRAVVDALDGFAGGSRFLVGHNVLGHDLPEIAAQVPDARLLRLPVVDTLWLSVLAFPRRPYHRLVKDHRLTSDSRNDPVADARLALRVLDESCAALATWPRDLLGVLRFALSRESAAGTATAVAERAPAWGSSSTDTATTASPPRAAAQSNAAARPVREHPDHGGHAALLADLGAPHVDQAAARSTFVTTFAERICRAVAADVFDAHTTHDPRPLAFVTAWLTADGTGSVLPRWLREKLPAVVDLVTALRDVDCGDPSCTWCRSEHSPEGLLQRWFGFDAFRDEPRGPDGASLQRAVVANGLTNRPTLAILPTGAGKSLCFQLPAIAAHARTGALTVVVSPLQALMKDQVEGFARRTASSTAAALNGSLTPPERSDVVERVRLGEVGMLYLSPEQLRSTSCARLLEGRQIRAWVFDEAHCVAKWGHDFRPDYLYAARFIAELAKRQGVPVPPVHALTATAKADVRDEIVAHFRAALGIGLQVLEAGVERTNLHFVVEELPRPLKDERIAELVGEVLDTGPGSVVVYCGTRKATEAVATFMREQRGIDAVAYHAGLDPGERRERQDAFVRGDVRVVCATNAFGMGIDKDDVRLVVHAQMPGSLENYLQEAGRAGRDLRDARCVLLYTESDPEEQFRLLRDGRLDARDLNELLKAVRRRAARDRDEVVVTPGELLRDDEIDTRIEADGRDATTKVFTAVAWLERAELLRRDENHTSVIWAKSVLANVAEARERIAKLDLPHDEREIWIAIYTTLATADPRFLLDTDTLAGLPALQRWEEQRRAEGFDRHEHRDRPSANVKALRVLHEMARHGLVTESVRLTAFLRHKVREPSKELAARVVALERTMLDALRETAPDAEPGEWYPLSLRALNQALLDRGIESDVDRLRRLLQSLTLDGQGAASSTGSLKIRQDSRTQWRMTLGRSWADVVETSKRRAAVAECIVAALVALVPATAPASKDTLVEFTLEDLAKAIDQDLLLRDALKDRFAAIDRALLFLHEQQAIVLQGGLAVFRRAMTLRLPSGERRRYTERDHAPLAEHYDEQIRSVHVMARYAEQGSHDIQSAQRLVHDYFALPRVAFRRRWFAGEAEALGRQTTPTSHAKIVDVLDADQRAAVTGSPEASLLVLAGPGSGKTRVVVHRAAWLLRVERVRPRSMLIVCFNRANAFELRRRLAALVDDDARGVTIGTYHGLAARLLGRSFAGRSGDAAIPELDALIPDATKLLRGEQGLLGIDADEQRDRLLGGFRHILVDEYQDIDEAQYEFLSALAGRTEQDPDAKRALFAVGDDDQAIYGFRGAKPEFIRRFTADYGAEIRELAANYRSTRAIVAAANQIIEPGTQRMKRRALHVDPARSGDDLGGAWARRDPQTRGLVQVLQVATDGGPREHRLAQAVAVADELQRLRATRPDGTPWASFAAVAFRRDDLAALRACLETRGVPVAPAHELAGARADALREVATFLDAVATHREIDGGALSAARDAAIIAAGDPDSPWWQLVDDLIADWRSERGDTRAAGATFVEFARDTVAESRRHGTSRDGVRLSTIHAAKGLEFDAVLVLDGGFGATAGDDLEKERRLYYVAATRARHMLCCVAHSDRRNLHAAAITGEHVARRSIRIAVDADLAARVVDEFELLEPKHLFLDFASRRAADDPTHQALARLRVGDRLTPVVRDDWIELHDPTGTAVAALSRAGRERLGQRLANLDSIRVVAVTRRERAWSEPAFRDRCRVDAWWLPVCELAWRR